MKTQIPILMTLAMLALPLAPSATAGQLDTWTWLNPLPTGNALNGVTHGLVNGNNLFVAVGANNTILTSPDGNTWVQQRSPATPSSSLTGVVYSSYQSTPLFVAVGADAATPPNNVILTSPDGTNWTANSQMDGIGTGGLLAIASDGNGDFMAVGNGGINLYSSASGGVTWTPNTPSILMQGVDFDGVAYGMVGSSPGSPGFVAVGSGGSIYNTTDDGISWTSESTSPQSSSDLSGITYNNGEFVAVGLYYIFNSPDGVNWQGTYGDTASAVVYGDNLFVTVADNFYTTYTSPGGSSGANTWTAYSGDYSFDAIDWNGSIFVAVGPGGTIGTSTGGINWTIVNTSVPAGTLHAIVYGPNTGLFVAGGAGNNQVLTVVTSTNGINWQPDTNSSINNVSLYYNAYITGLAFGIISGSPPTPPIPGFVATINSTAGYSGPGGEIISSLDGINWSTPDYYSGKALNAIASGNGRFVAVGAGGTNIVSSSDLTLWATGVAASGSVLPSATSFSFNGVAFGTPNSTPTFVAVGGTYLGGGQVIYYSSDSINWNAAGNGPPSTDYFYSVAYGNGMFVAVGDYESSEYVPYGVIYTSSDGGNTWIQQMSTATLAPINGVTYANGLFVAVTSGNGSGATILVSSNGVSWEQSSMASPDTLLAVASGDYQYIAVGGNDAILGSVQAAVANGNEVNGVFSFTAYGPPGTTYGVYVSLDLVNWNWLKNETIPPGAESVPVTDGTSVNYSSGYYYLGPPGPPQ